ncbi:MAG: PEP-CTERM sorting domain-containing protein [Verrucomicrobia bacterium]|jgi:hypothetical protein|nr:PEP-CTERM sorting domain-containing protein [Verrucomicrobiota bacterium]
MRPAFLLLLAHWLLGCIAVLSQDVFVYDQQSSTTDWPPSCGGVFSPGDPPGHGQSFTPSLSAVGFIRLKLADGVRGNSTGAIMQIDLRSDSITGPLLGTSLPVEMADGFAGTADFLFAPDISVTPQVMYYFEPRVLFGDTWCVDVMEDVYNYPRGTWIAMGRPDVSVDCWFQEGIIIPEPSEMALLLCGLGAILLGRRRF